MITVVIVNRDRRELLLACLESVVRAAERVNADAGGQPQIVVMDNGSTDGSQDSVRSRFPEVQLIESGVNLGFAGAVAAAIDSSVGEFVALVNNDAVLDADCLLHLVTACETPTVGSVNPQVRFMANPEVVNTTGLAIDNLGIAFDRGIGEATAEQPDEPVEIFGVSGCVALYRREMLRSIGGFDAAFFAYAEDADIAWRARMAGWRSLYVPEAIALHHGSATSQNASDLKYRLVGRNRVRLLAKNATLGQLMTWGWAMLAYDLAYVTLVFASERSAAPLWGRLDGIRQWRSARRLGRPTRHRVALAGRSGPLGALRMRRFYGRFAA